MSEMDVMYEMDAANEQFDIDYAIVQAFERSKREERKAGSGRTFTIILMAVFFVVLMVGLATGVTMAMLGHTGAGSGKKTRLP